MKHLKTFSRPEIFTTKFSNPWKNKGREQILHSWCYLKIKRSCRQSHETRETNHFQTIRWFPSHVIKINTLIFIIKIFKCKTKDVIIIHRVFNSTKSTFTMVDTNTYLDIWFYINIHQSEKNLTKLMKRFKTVSNHKTLIQSRYPWVVSSRGLSLVVMPNQLSQTSMNCSQWFDRILCLVNFNSNV